MSHHYSGPNFGFPRGDARLDLTDLYAFPKPGDAGTSIVISDVHPPNSFAPPGATPTEPFAPEGLYQRMWREDPSVHPRGGSAARRQALPTTGHQPTRCAIRTLYRRACGKVRVWRWLRATT